MQIYWYNPSLFVHHIDHSFHSICSKSPFEVHVRLTFREKEGKYECDNIVLGPRGEKIAT